MTQPLRALSIMQPWAWLIIHGHKDIENRDWKPWNPGLRFRGTFLIHTGVNIDPSFKPEQKGNPHNWWWPDIHPPPTLDHGGIVGDAEIVDVVTASGSRWFHGPYGLVIRNARPLPFRPCRGALGFFDPDKVPAPRPRAPKPPPRQGGLL